MTKSPTIGAVSAGVVTAAMSGDTLQITVSLGVGIISTLIARGIFTTREARRSRDRPPLREQLYLTAAAVIITGVTIWDRKAGLATATAVGFGVGLSVSTILDVFGDKARQMFGGMARQSPGIGLVPDDQSSGEDGSLKP